MKTATIENVNKMSKYGLKRRPTYEEIIGVIDESNKKSLGNFPIGQPQCLKVAQKEVFLMVRIVWSNLEKNRQDYY